MLLLWIGATRAAVDLCSPQCGAGEAKGCDKFEGFDMCFLKQTDVPPGSLLLSMECPAKNCSLSFICRCGELGHRYSLNFWMLVVREEHWSWLPACPVAFVEKDSGSQPLNVKQPC